MAGCTGRSNPVVLPNYPGVAFEIDLVAVRFEENSVFGLFIDFDLRMIGSHMALSTALRLSRLSTGKQVPRMTGGAGASRAIRIDTPYARVGPGSGVEFATFEHLDDTAMTLLTAKDCGCCSLDDLAE